ncbi:MAG TPA: hypothetical protein VJR24_08805 [Gemmatimonadaceae bacterium]|nr:hypothetical protein [Gemmatimonadaceae bacterium]
MLRRHTLILLAVAAAVAACTSPTAPRPTSHDEQITIGPHPDVAVVGPAIAGR